MIFVGLLSAALVALNIAMTGYLARTQLEEAANHLQIQSLLAARTLEDPLTVYSHELEERDHDDHHDEHEEREHHRDDKHRDHEAPAERLSEWAESFARRSGSAVTVTDKRGEAIAGQTKPLVDLELEAARSGHPYHRWTHHTVVATAPISRRGKLLGVVRLEVSREEAAQRSRAMSLRLAVVSLVTLLLAVSAALLLSRRLVKPLKQLEQSALRAAEGQWEQPVIVSGQDEIASLSTAFSTMLSELRKMMQRRRQFVSDASHELRTPLTRMKLRTEALLDGALEEPETARKFAEELDGEVNRMTELTRALLDISKFDEGKAPGEPTKDPSILLRNACGAFAELAGQRNLELQQDISQNLPPLRISPHSLRTAVGNLLENALKYTPEGGRIEVRAESGSGGVRIDVSDTGPGIAPEHLPHLFERFYRADPSRKERGTGLGLALVKAAVESAGGNVGVSSEVGKGSVFTIRLPS